MAIMGQLKSLMTQQMILHSSMLFLIVLSENEKKIQLGVTQSEKYMWECHDMRELEENISALLV